MKRQHGFTMLELLISVGVISLAAIATIGFYQQVSARQTADEVRKQIMIVQSAIKELYPDPNRTGLSATVLINAQKLPPGMVNGTSIVHKGGGAITVAPGNAAGGVANSGYTITVANVDPKDCATLAVHMGNTFPYLSVNGYAVKYPGSASTVNASTAATYCAYSTSPSIQIAGI